MHLEKDGNLVIDDILTLSNQFILKINELDYKISPITYSHFYLYRGRKLSQKELDEILIFDRRSKVREYLITLLSKQSYSEHQLQVKLKKKNVSILDRKAIINDLKSLGYINDKNYCDDKFELLERKHFGKNKIIKVLLDDGISNELINNLSFINEETKAKALMKNYLLIHKSLNYNQLKHGLYRYLISNGFENEIITKVLDENLIEDDQKDLVLLKKTIEKYVILHHLDLNDLKDEQKLLSYLMRKGYSYDCIKLEIRRLKHNEIY